MHNDILISTYYAIQPSLPARHWMEMKEICLCGIWIHKRPQPNSMVCSRLHRECFITDSHTQLAILLQARPSPQMEHISSLVCGQCSCYFQDGHSHIYSGAQNSLCIIERESGNVRSVRRKSHLCLLLR